MPQFFLSLRAMAIMEEISHGAQLSFRKATNEPYIEFRNGDEQQVELQIFEELVGLDGRFLEYSHAENDVARYRLTPDGNRLIVALKDQN